MPPSQATGAVHGDAPARWDGVALTDLLVRMNLPMDKPLRGHDLSGLVRVTASDGYQVVFSLGELDPTLGGERVLIAYARNGEPLAKDGPLRLVVPGDKRGARWVRNVVAIDVIDAAPSRDH